MDRFKISTNLSVEAGGTPTSFDSQAMQHGTGPGIAPGMGQLTLQSGQVDIWVTLTHEIADADLAVPFNHVLNDDERRQYAKFVFEKDRRRYLITRALVRYALSRYTSIQPAQWRFAATAFGRPFIVDPPRDIDGLTFNISHSDHVVLLGITHESRLGIDVEDQDRTMPLDMADHFFSADEVRQLHALPADAQMQRFLDFWTLKESYIKACGKGLSIPLDTFGFELDTGRPLQVRFDPSLNDSPGNWTFWQWRPSPGSIAALCVENQPGVQKTIHVRRAIPFASEERVGFDALRTSLA